MGNYEGATVIFADGAKYEDIVKEFGKTRQFESIYAGKTALRVNVDVIEIDMNNPNSGLRYSQVGNPIVGANILKTGDIVDFEKELSLLRNKRIEAVTINQNIAVYIDDNPDTITISKNFIDSVKNYVKNDNLGTNIKILLSNEYIDKILKLLEQELGSEQTAKEKFAEIIKGFKKDNNKEIVVIFDKVDEETNLSEYKQYGIFSYVANNEYVDGLTSAKSKIKIVTNLNQIFAFDGSLSIIKVSAFREELEKTSGIFTFLTSSLNLSEYLKTRSINFVKQIANNFDFDQIPVMDVNVIGQILTESKNKFEELSKYLSGTDSVSIYYLGLTDDEQRNVFVEEILKRALVINYLRSLEEDNAYYGLKDKNLENVLAKALFEKIEKMFENDKELFKNGRFEDSFANVDTNVVETFYKKLEEKLNKKMPTATDVEFELLQTISQLTQKAFEQNDSQAIDDIIHLIPAYADRNIELRTSNAAVMDINAVKGILSAA